MFVKLFFRKINQHLGLFANGILRKKLYNGFCTEPQKTAYKYLLILDFEATCEEQRKISQEIIEFPCLKVNLNTLLEEGRFHHYVRPVVEPILSPFCIELTGILQEVVDNAKTFPEVYKLFEEWREQEGLTDENSLYLTSGNWDLGSMFPSQCARCNIEIPSHMRTWVDIKRLFADTHRIPIQSFTDVMNYYNLEFQGRHHSGIDDTLNMLRAVKKMVDDGVMFKPTTRLPDLKVEKIGKR